MTVLGVVWGLCLAPISSYTLNHVGSPWDLWMVLFAGSFLLLNRSCEVPMGPGAISLSHLHLWSTLIVTDLSHGGFLVVLGVVMASSLKTTSKFNGQ